MWGFFSSLCVCCCIFYDARGTEVNNVIIILEYCVVFSQTISLSCSTLRGTGDLEIWRYGRWGAGWGMGVGSCVLGAEDMRLGALVMT